MKKKLFSLMMMCLFAFTGAYAQIVDVEIGVGPTTTNSYLPSQSFYNNALTQQIYTAEEIGEAGSILSVAIYNGGTTKTRNYDMYLVETTKTKFDSIHDWIAATAEDKVFSGSVTLTAGQWTTFMLDVPFAYDGTSNLALVMDDNTGSWSSGLAGRVFDADSSALVVYSDGTNYNPLDPSAYNGTILSVKNQLKLQVIPNTVVFDGDLPTNSYYKFTVSQQIFTPADFGEIAEVGAVSFFNMGMEMTRNLDVYMTLVDTANFDGTFANTTAWVDVDSTDLVFSGDVTFRSLDWTKITFDTAYSYDGYSYVILTVDDNTDVAIEGLNFYVEETADTMAMYYHSDDSTRINPNPTELTVEGVLSGVRNNVVFDSYMYELTVADSTATSSYVPVYGLWADAYQKAEFVVPADELTEMSYSSITGLKFYAQNANISWGAANFQVFIKEVPATGIDDFSGNTGATVVYEGPLSIVNYEMVVELTTPYYYQGGNLLVGVYENTKGTYTSCSWYGKIVNDASVQGYNSSSLDGVTATQRNFIPKTTFTYAPGLAPVVLLDPDLYILDDPESTTPITMLDLGYRPNHAWMRPANWTLYNMTGRAVNVRDHDFTPNPNYFALVAPEVPFMMDVDGAEELYFYSDSLALEGDSIINRQFVLFYDNVRSASVWNIRAHAYDPVENDVWELATELTMNDLPYFDSLHVYDTAGNRVLYDNYLMLPEDTVPGLENNDAVYKLTFDNDVILNAYVYGANGKIAIYPEDFNAGTSESGYPGPHTDNMYEGPSISDIAGGGGGAASDYDVVVGDSTGTGSYLPFYTLYNYSISQQLYLAAELNEAGVQPGLMSQIGFRTNTSYSYTEQGIKIWMANVNDAALGATTLQTNNMTLVYEGECTPVQGWNMFNIEAAGFEWDGTSNVVIAFQRNNGSWHSSISWVRTNTSFVSAIYAHNDAAAYDMTAQSYDIYSYNQVQNRAVTRFVSGVPNREYAANNNGYYHYNHSTNGRNRTAETLTVNDATATNSYVPVYGFYADAYLRCQYVMPAADLAAMNGAAISQMEFYLSGSAADAWTGTFQVYMTEVTDATISAFIDPADATTVYTGTLDATGSTMTVVFDNNYTYNGGNLLIGFDETAPDNYKSATFYGAEATGACVQGYSYSSLSSVSPTSRNFLPKTTFTYTTTAGGGDEPGTVTVMDTIYVSALPSEEAGYVTAEGLNEGVGVYEEGTSLELTATANEGWHFVQWEDGETLNPRTVTVNENNAEYSATFEHDSYVTGGIGFDFEGGQYGYSEDWPADWTVDAGWYLGNEATDATPAKQGTSAFFDGTTPNTTADLVLPAVNFIGYSTMSFDYIASGTNRLEVLYGPSTEHLTNLFGPAGTGTAGWASIEIDLDALGDVEGDRSNYVIVFRATGGTGVTGLDNIRHNQYGDADASILGMPVEAGTYYLVVSSTDRDFEVRIDAQNMPCPELASNPSPADDADSLQPNRVNLHWTLGQYTTAWRLVFGTTYYPDPNHAQTIVYPQEGDPGAFLAADGNWYTTELAEGYTVRNLWNNTNYFWRVDQWNTNCAIAGDVWGFTTHLNVPDNLRLADESIFEGEDAVLLWNSIQDRTFRRYNIYVDDVLYDQTEVTYIPDLYLTSIISGLTYNMNPGYKVQVSAVYDEGESAKSEPLMVKVSGYGTMRGHVYEQDGTTGIAGATVTFVGENEFGEDSTYTVTTNAAGLYTISMQVSRATSDSSYWAQAQCEGYNNNLPVDPVPEHANKRAVVHNQTTTTNFIMDESFLPVARCIEAEYYPNPLFDSAFVRLRWTSATGTPGGGGGGTGEALTVCDGTSTIGSVPVYGLWMDDYTRCEMVYPASILAPLAGTQISSLKYYISTPASGSWGAASFNVYLNEVGSTTINSYYGTEGATVVYSGSLDGTGTEMTINFTTPYTYNGGNLLVGIEEPVVGTWYSCYFYGIDAAGSSASGYSGSSLSAVSFNQRNFLPKTTFNAGRSSEVVANREDRSFDFYRIYRTSCYNDGPYNSENTVLLGNNDTPADTVFVDVNWQNVPAGVYKWGVSRVYAGNREDYPNGRESEIMWSCDCIDRDMYIPNVDIQVLLNSADSPEGTRVTFTNVNEGEQEAHPVPALTLDETGYYEFETFRRGTYEVTVSLPGYETKTEIVDLWNGGHLRYVLIELLTPVTNLYVSRTGWAMWEPVVAGGAGGSFIDFETGDLSQFDFENGTTGYPWTVTSDNAFAGTYSMKSTNSGAASTTSAISAEVDYNAAGTVSFAALCMGEGTYTAWDKCIFEIDGMQQFAYGAHVSGWQEYSYDVNAGTHTFTWKYTKDSSVNPTGDAMWVDNIDFGGGRVRSFGNDRHLEGYKVMCTALDGEQIYNHNTISLEPFCQLATETSIGEPLIEGATYICQVAAIYSTGQSPWTSVEWVYEPCDHWGPVDVVTVNTTGDGNLIEWTFENGYNPYDPTNGGDEGGAKGGDRAVYGQADLTTGMLATGLYAFNITDIDNFDERVFFIGSLVKDNRFDVIVDKNNSVFLIAAGRGTNEGELEANFNAFRAANAAAFAQMDKDQAAEVTATMKAELPYEFVNGMMMDIFIKSRENNLCALADPFCTDNGMYQFPAGVNAGTAEPGPNYSCLSTQPNPAWYYMRIGEPGAIDIYMYSTPSVDIDFCCWGPFDDPVSPCPNGLTADKVVSCSYSPDPTEHCLIPSGAQTGEYYILVITNYSNQTCNINFSAVGGAGSTDCGILPPVDIIGFLITQDGEYLDIVGPTVREYTDLDEYGDHEYCVRPIYPGLMELPDHNYGWSMGCPVCEYSDGEMTCEPGAPINGNYLYNEDGSYGALISWGEQEPTPQPGENFVEDFESGDLGEWISIRNGEGTDYTDWRVVNSETLFTSGPIPAHSGVYVAMSRSWNSSAYNVDNWLISPQVTLDGTLSYWALDDGQYHEYYDVYVSTTTNDINAFSLLYEAPTPTGDWMEYTVDLSAYAGQQGYIAFRHQSYDGDYLFLDDVTIDYGRSNRSDIIAYNVYRSTDNVGYSLIATVPATDEDYYEYFDQTAAGEYYYQVTAVYDNGCESEPAANAVNPALDYVMVMVTGIDDNMNKVALYPNPTHGLVKIEAAGMRHITVVSVLGQVVYDTELSADEYELNMAQWNAGVYMVRIATENGVSTQRVTVVR